MYNRAEPYLVSSSFLSSLSWRQLVQWICYVRACPQRGRVVCSSSSCYGSSTPSRSFYPSSVRLHGGPEQSKCGNPSLSLHARSEASLTATIHGGGGLNLHETPTNGSPRASTHSLQWLCVIRPHFPSTVKRTDTASNVLPTGASFGKSTQVSKETTSKTH